MLNKINTFISCHIRALLGSLKALCRTPIATMMTLTVVAIALTLPALFWVLTNNMKQLPFNWSQGGHISLYLHTPLALPEETALLSRVQQTEGVLNASLKSAAEGLTYLQQQDGLHDLLQYLPENPLPAVIEVVPTEVAMATPLKIAHLFNQLKIYPHVEQAKLDMQWVTRLYGILTLVTKLSQMLLLFLGFTVVMIIGNTLRLAVHTGHKEVQVLKLIGATDAYIARPFLYLGLWFGLFGAMGALILIDLFLVGLTPLFRHVLMLYHISSRGLVMSFYQVMCLIGWAMLLGFVGARFSVNRQLACIEPYA
ncbi:MAG: cell division protein [Legionellales bacterium RIFCSPHIGHO2_12_FULL_42_9]|nr:MAG: cell division protein [Legionellales bacterium RIFCSPHIGHO2_12_FULL_42_9]